MAKIVKNNSGIRGVKFFIFLIAASWTFLGWPGIKQAQAAVAYFNSASTPADNGTNTTSPTVVTPPSNMLAGDLVLLFAWGSGTTDPVISQAGGQTWSTLAVRTSTSRDGRTFGARYNGIWSANPSVTMPGTSNNIVVMHVFRPTNGANIWAFDVAEVNTTYTAPTTPFTVTVTGINTLTDGAVAVAIWTSADDNTWGSLAGAGWSVLGAAQYRNTSGTNDGSQSFAYQVKATAGATGNVSKNQATLGGDAGTRSIIAFKEVPVTLSISVSPLTWGVGTVDAATTQMSTSGNKINVTNDGNVAETFTLQIFDEDDRNEWTHSSLKTGAGNNIYVLSGIFCATADSPTQTSFSETDSEDVLTTAQQTATSTKFAYAGGSANAVAVAVSGQRSLWLRLDMPTAVSGTYAYEQHTVTVRISCQQS